MPGPIQQAAWGHVLHCLHSLLLQSISCPTTACCQGWAWRVYAAGCHPVKVTALAHLGAASSSARLPLSAAEEQQHGWEGPTWEV